MERSVSSLTLIVLVTFIATSALGTEPPRGGGELPDAYIQLLNSKGPRALTYRHGLMPYVESVLQARALSQSQSSFIKFQMESINPTLAQATGRVEGIRHAPVLLVEYSDTKVGPDGKQLYEPIKLQQRLFGPSARLTIPEFYQQMSHGLFTVDGTVYAWTRVSKPESYYVGHDYWSKGKWNHCYGLCPDAKIGELIKEVLDSHPEIPWELYDNDGPDGKPNSGDDDGYVDFVAFVLPSTGGECNDGNTHVWSHRYNLVDLNGEEYVTKRPSAPGGFIKIVDYTVQPAYSCDGADVNQIGVFAHEFGHAFGLPDLYDTTNHSGGIGNWCLMAGGSWGGDGKSPDQPVQMSPWAKEFLGWVDPVEISGDTKDIPIVAYEDPPPNGPDVRVYRYSVSENLYYLIANAQRKLSNAKLPGSGLQIWLINQTVVRSGMKTNRVNVDPTNRGVGLIEADGLRQLDKDKPRYSGGPDDLFPGTKAVKSFDNHTAPSSISNFAVCEISDPGNPMHFAAYVTTGLCPSPEAHRSAPNSSPTPPSAMSVTNDESGTRGAPPQSAINLTNVTQNPSEFIGKEITISGQIKNLGANLQLRSGRHIVFQDLQGIVIDARLPAPIEAIQGPQNGEYTPTSPIILDQPATITGRIEKGKDGKLILRIDGAMTDRQEE